VPAPVTLAEDAVKSRIQNESSRQGGFGLLEVIAAGGVITAVVLAAVQIVASHQKTARKLGADLDARFLASTVQETVSCQNTFPAGSPMPPCAAGSLIQLRRNNGAVLITVPTGTGAAVGNPRAVYTEVGTSPDNRWQLRAVCRADGVEVQAQAVAGAGAAVRVRADEVTREPRAFSRPGVRAHPRSVVTTGLCGGFFSSALARNVDCSASGRNTLVSGVDFERGVFNCVPVPTCTAEEALRMVDGVYSCVNIRAIAQHEADALRRELTAPVDQLSQRTDVIKQSVTVLTSTSQSIDQRTDALNRTIDDGGRTLVNIRSSMQVSSTSASTLTQQFNGAGLGDLTEARGRNDSECQERRRMVCPDGYMAFAYEARFLGTDNNCSLTCRRLIQ
jgi:hypothetical protein